MEVPLSIQLKNATGELTRCCTQNCLEIPHANQAAYRIQQFKICHAETISIMHTGQLVSALTAINFLFPTGNCTTIPKRSKERAKQSCCMASLPPRRPASCIALCVLYQVLEIFK
ncbi:hypothetical protein ACLOJK_013075 [Asimina triloba]